MAVRLKYAGINIDKIQIEKDYEELLNKALATTSEGRIFIYCPPIPQCLK